MPSGIGYGAMLGLESILAEKFKQQLEAQRRKEHADDVALRTRQLDQQAERDRAISESRQRDDEWRSADYLNGLRDRQSVRDAQDNARQDLSGLTQMYQLAQDPQSRLQLEQAIVNRGGEVVKPAAAPRPISVSPGHTLFDPSSGKSIFTAPAVGSNLRMVDKSYPPAIQAEVLRLRQQHPNFEAALGALATQLPQWQQQYPDLEPQKLANALRANYTGAGGSDDPVDALLNEVLGTASSGGTVGEPSLEDAARRVLEQAKYPATPENIAKFLANPTNRQRLAGGGGQ